ncbi:MAG: hypothetical protein ABFE08_09095 [Armatimonadia bacterium]
MAEVDTSTQLATLDLRMTHLEGVLGAEQLHAHALLLERVSTILQTVTVRLDGVEETLKGHQSTIDQARGIRAGSFAIAGALGVIGTWIVEAFRK